MRIYASTHLSIDASELRELSSVDRSLSLSWLVFCRASWRGLSHYLVSQLFHTGWRIFFRTLGHAGQSELDERDIFFIVFSSCKRSSSQIENPGVPCAELEDI